MEEPVDRSFRNEEYSTAFFVACVLTVLVGLITALYALAYVPVLTVAVLAGGGLLIWLWFLLFKRSRVDVNRQGILVVNLLREDFVPWSEFESFGSGLVLTIATKPGRTIRAWSVMSSNWSGLLNKPGYADAVASQILNMRAWYSTGEPPC